MAGDDLDLIERATALFNRMLDPDAPERDREEAERVWAPEPEIVPMRAALEDVIYTGPDAVERFREDSLESWSELRIEMEEIERIGARYLASGTLRGRGRESGAEITTQLWWVVDIDDGRIARVAVYFDHGAAIGDAES